MEAKNSTDDILTKLLSQLTVLNDALKKQDENLQTIISQNQQQQETSAKFFTEIQLRQEEACKLLNEARNSAKNQESQTPSSIDELPYQVELNVGGKHFSVSKDTLCKQESSYFTGLLGSSLWSKGNEGAFFIDRDPKFFRIIINYLRTDILDISTLTSTQIDILKHELDYYQIQVDPGIFPSPPPPPPHLGWDAETKHPQLRVSNNNKRLTCPGPPTDPPQRIDWLPARCIPPNRTANDDDVLSFSVKVFFEAAGEAYFMVGYVSKQTFRSDGQGMDPYWCIHAYNGRIISRANEIFEARDYLNADITSNSIFTVTFDPILKTITYIIDGVPKGVAFRNVPKEAELCPYIEVCCTCRATFDLLN